MWRDIVAVAGRLASKDGARVGGQFVRHVAPAVIKPARIVWNQVIGFIFFCLAVPFGFKAASFARANDGRWIPVAVVCAFLMTFAVHSFWRAHRISRS